MGLPKSRLNGCCKVAVGAIHAVMGKRRSAPNPRIGTSKASHTSNAIRAYINDVVAMVQVGSEEINTWSPAFLSVLQAHFMNSEFAPYALLLAFLPLICWAMGETTIEMVGKHPTPGVFSKGSIQAKPIMWMVINAQPGIGKTMITKTFRDALKKLEEVQKELGGEEGTRSAVWGEGLLASTFPGLLSKLQDKKHVVAIKDEAVGFLQSADNGVMTNAKMLQEYEHLADVTDLKDKSSFTFNLLGGTKPSVFWDWIKPNSGLFSTGIQERPSFVHHHQASSEEFGDDGEASDEESNPYLHKLWGDSTFSELTPDFSEVLYMAQTLCVNCTTNKVSFERKLLKPLLNKCEVRWRDAIHNVEGEYHKIVMNAKLPRKTVVSAAALSVLRQATLLATDAKLTHGALDVTTAAQWKEMAMAQLNDCGHIEVTRADTELSIKLNEALFDQDELIVNFDPAAAAAVLASTAIDKAMAEFPPERLKKALSEMLMKNGRYITTSMFRQVCSQQWSKVETIVRVFKELTDRNFAKRVMYAKCQGPSQYVLLLKPCMPGDLAFEGFLLSLGVDTNDYNASLEKVSEIASSNRVLHQNLEKQYLQLDSMSSDEQTPASTPQLTAFARASTAPPTRTPPAVPDVDLRSPENEHAIPVPTEPEEVHEALAMLAGQELRNTRNIGISAHIDSGKTTLTERILFYTGRINSIHEVRGKDGVGAKMDSMDLEREKGITIQSAATYATWKDTSINIIDTPGHVDFTIEVERALRVLDGAILVLCSVGGVQSQSITVDRQMRRYHVPRMAFINKCDRVGADPKKVMKQLRDKLRLNSCAVQLPIGLEDNHKGLVDVVRMRAVYFLGDHGQHVEEAEVPAEMREEAAAARVALIEQVAEVDDELGELFLEGEAISVEQLKAAIRRSTTSNKFVPVFMGSAYKNKGVQLLLDGVTDYLPAPLEVVNEGLDLNNDEQKLRVGGSPDGPMIGLAFKLEEGKFGQLTYLRLYQGTIKKGDTIFNVKTNKKVKVPRLVRMHSDEMEDITVAKSGDIVALFGVDCASGDTFTDGKVNIAMTSIRVPEAVLSLAVAPKSKDMANAFSKALSRFQKEDPTFRVHLDNESAQTIISGMGELHLEVYTERMKREYKVETEVGKPRVNFREKITKRVDFDYLHKKQSGGQGQYGRVIGYIEPMTDEELEELNGEKFEFVNGCIGNNIPPGFIPSIEKGFKEAVNCGQLIGHPVEGCRVTLLDGAAHAVDSNEMAFKLAAMYAFSHAYKSADPVVLEPIMSVEVTVPVEFQGSIVGNLNRRKGVIQSSEQEADDVIINCHVPLNEMFGYSTDLRSMTQGKGEFTMAYENHSPVTYDTQKMLVDDYSKTRYAK